MKTRFAVAILLAVFLIGSSGVAMAGGKDWSGAKQHSMAEKSAINQPIMVSTEYLEYLEIEKGLETGTLTAPGVHSGIARHPAPVEKTAGVSSPVMAPNDFLEYLEVEGGIETGSLTAPGVSPTEIPGPSEKVDIPEGG